MSTHRLVSEKIGLGLFCGRSDCGALCDRVCGSSGLLGLGKKNGTSEADEVSEVIRTGARTFLNIEFTMVAIFGAVLAVMLHFLLGSFVALTFVIGAVLSGLSGYIGVTVAVHTNAKTSRAALKSFREAFGIATNSGTVAGMSLAGLALLGVSLLYIIVRNPVLLLGLGFGASLICLFARVGGGIYTKAADIGADLVGKIEIGIPEDDPRNPAVIADQVGDNVGDIAGTGSDVFQSYVMALVAAMILGETVHGLQGLAYPMLVAAAGIVSSSVASFFAHPRNSDGQRAMYRTLYVAVIVVSMIAAFLAWMLFGNLHAFYPTLVGIVAVVLFACVTLYYTSPNRRPVLDIAGASTTGPATNLIFGLARGFESTVLQVVIFAVAVVLASFIDGLYGISMVAVGFLSITATLVAMASYGPVVDNASGIIQILGFHGEARETTRALDAVGNTTKAVCKGYAIETSAFAQVAILSAFITRTNLKFINLANPSVIAGLLIGAMLSFLIVSQILTAVGKSAYRMIEEERRQFSQIPGLKEGKAKPDYTKCVDISSRWALRSMFIPASLTITIPIMVGFVLGVESVGGLIAGNLITTLPLALMMVQGGAALDNAKKFVEAGNLGGIGSSTHAATVIGDMVGDSLKDAAGASLDVLMNLIGIVSILFASLFVAHHLFP
jgi:K(+)-stimulated pyrophosphate-energized sodium pump